MSACARWMADRKGRAPWCRTTPVALPELCVSRLLDKESEQVQAPLSRCCLRLLAFVPIGRSLLPPSLREGRRGARASDCRKLAGLLREVAGVTPGGTPKRAFISAA